MPCLAWLPGHCSVIVPNSVCYAKRASLPKEGGDETPLSCELASSGILFQVPKDKYARDDRPSRCPHCPGVTFQRWGGLAKAVQDHKTWPGMYNVRLLSGTRRG
jgi:hypothetical protein